ncbi:eight transmembrane protein EpsH, putative exosortase [Rivularia sp. PCC 7116]|uniref:cyanoexosortase B n=1 Tax=Rivularia sp. PCC 7116 TaxID=373994 RepID=UPI00029F0978|nr:cyanoexosortase B [Rivularia sp. PCC 7116]AFY53348.1 eight transmembrane protein EpsH, putative exosortase [Rivularia sp. PCC 7116]
MLTQHQVRRSISPQIFNFIILGILVLLYAPLVHYWYDGWISKNISTEHEYFSHGIIGFPFAAYLVWMNRKQWVRLPDKTHVLGAILLALGAVFYVSGVGEWVNLSLPVILTGLCLWLKGIEGFKLQSFPLLLVLLATPNSVPYLIAPFTLPLQSFIAGTAGFILNQFGLPVVVDGINIYARGRIVEVAPYCAGLKMLFTTIYVGLILLFWTDTLSSKRKSSWFLFVAVIISVTANIIRNTLLTFFHATEQDGAFHWLHDSWGGDLYSACMLLVLIPVINWIDSYFSESPVRELEGNER